MEEKVVFAEFNKFRSGMKVSEVNFIRKGKLGGLLSAEKILLGILLRNPQMVSLVKKDVDVSDFIDEEVREIISFLYTSPEINFIKNKPHLLLADKPHLFSLISELEFMEIEDEERELKECIRRISIRSKERLCTILKENIIEAEKRGEAARQVELLDKYNRLKRVIEYEKKEIAKRC